MTMPKYCWGEIIRLRGESLGCPHRPEKHRVYYVYSLANNITCQERRNYLITGSIGEDYYILILIGIVDKPSNNPSEDKIRYVVEMKDGKPARCDYEIFTVLKQKEIDELIVNDVSDRLNPGTVIQL